MAKNKIILGFTGLIASGKGTACKYLIKKYSAKSLTFSTPLSDILDRLYLPKERKNYQVLFPMLGKTFGQDILSKVIAQDVEALDTELVLVDGVRRWPDIEHLKKFENFKLVGIDVEERTRYERLLKRGEKEGDADKTWEDFQKENLASTEINIPELIEKSDVKIDNNGSLEDFYKQLDNLVK